MSEFLFNFIGFTLLGAVAIVLIMGIYTLFKGGNTSKKYSNKLMQLRVLLQFIAIIVLVLLAYFFKDIGVKNLKTYYDPELRLVKWFKLRGLPTSILINKEGKEFGKIIGEIDFASDEFINFLRKYI